MKNTLACMFGLALLGLSLPSPALMVSDELHHKLQQELDTVWAQGPKLGDTMFFLREAGGAYLPDLMPAADPDRYQDMDRRRLMVGVHWMDLTYASTFYQVEPSARFGQAIGRLLESLGHPWPEMERGYREALEQIDQPGGEERLQALFRQLDADTGWKEMLRDGDGLELVVDGLYGYLVEGLYIASEIAVLSNYESNYMRFVGDTRNAFLVFQDMLREFESDPELTGLMQASERLQFIAQLLTIIGDAPEIGPEQVLDLRPVITKARNDIVF